MRMTMWWTPSEAVGQKRMEFCEKLPFYFAVFDAVIHDFYVFLMCQPVFYTSSLMTIAKIWFIIIVPLFKETKL
jgi:hypothetical protein